MWEMSTSTHESRRAISVSSIIVRIALDECGCAKPSKFLIM